MKKLIILLTALFVGFVANAQKVKIKNEIATVDGVEYVKVKKDPVTASVKNVATLSDSTLIYLKTQSYKDPNRVDAKGVPMSVYYLEVINANTGEIYFESGVGIKNTIKAFYLENVITANGINEANMQKLAIKYGFDYSRRRDELSR
ncbi:MAG: hypothetical protein H6607_06480 [Flavobacteriales bacterium]|nr:hypothetical protein [Flavobacteriales bacterium]